MSYKFLNFIFQTVAGQAPPPLFPIPIEEEDTPRTYRSEVDMETDYIKTDPDSALISNKEALQSLSITFEFFKKAVVSTTYWWHEV